MTCPPIRGVGIRTHPEPEQSRPPPDASPNGPNSVDGTPSSPSPNYASSYTPPAGFWYSSYSSRE